MQLQNVALVLAALASAASAHPSGPHHDHHRHHVRHSNNLKREALAPMLRSSHPQPAGTFCGGNGASKTRRATTEEIMSKGNTGTPGHYGCNIKSIDPASAGAYRYVINATNVAATPYQFVCWNKIGRDGLMDGWFKGHGESVDNMIQPGSSALVAVDSNSQGGCGFGPGSVPVSSNGQYMGTWLEWDFDSARNGGWSGADCSDLVASDNGGQTFGCQVCRAGGPSPTCSTIYGDGTGQNAYTKGTNSQDGVGLNIEPGSDIMLDLLIGYSG